MTGRPGVCSGSLSRGAALTRIVILVVVSVVLFFAVRTCFPSREVRLWRAIDRGREALAGHEEEDFFAAFDKSMRYRASGGLDDLRRDYRRFVASGLGAPNVVEEHATLDATGADVRLEVVFVAGLRPVAQASVAIRAEDEDGTWKVTSLAWK